VANKRKDLLDEKMEAFSCTERAGRTLELKFFTNLNKKTFKWVFDLTKRNMQEITGAEWNDEEKKQELKEEDARYLVLHDKESKAPQGFVHFRFVYEETVEVLYVYEIQLEESIQRQGVGKFLMQACEVIAKQNRMAGVMLTCSKSNQAGMEFYLKKLKYSIDPISPSYVNPSEEYDYEIVSKIFDEKAKRRLQQQADEAREEFLEGSESESEQSGCEEPSAAESPEVTLAKPENAALGSSACYTKTGEMVEILKCHKDDPEDVYFTILLPDGSEKQTVEKYLEFPSTACQ